MEQWPVWTGICLLLTFGIDAQEDGLAKAVDQLRQEMADMRQQRAQDQRTMATLIRRCQGGRPAGIDSPGVEQTPQALQSESRPLSTLDAQIRDLKSSLESLAVHKNWESRAVQAFRNELLLVKSEMDVMKRQMEMSDSIQGSSRLIHNVETSSENAAKTLQWLLSSVNELKNDVAQIDRNLNFSAAMQRSERIDQQLDSLQLQLNQLSHQATHETASRQKLVAQLLEMRQDLDLATRTLQHLQINFTRFNSQMEQGTESNVQVEERSSAQRVHYDGHLNAKYQEVKGNLRAVSEKQRQLEDQWHSDGKQMRRIESKLELLDELAVNLSLNMATLDKVQASYATLSQSIDLMQEVNDFEMRALRSALDRLRLNVTGIWTQSEDIFRHQEKLRERLIQLSANVGSMENQMQEDRLTLMTLQNQALNESLQRCKDENQPHIQDAQIRSVQGQLQALKEQMQVLNSTLSARSQLYVAQSIGAGSVNSFTSDASSEESSEECADTSC